MRERERERLGSEFETKGERDREGERAETRREQCDQIGLLLNDLGDDYFSYKSSPNIL